MVKIVRANDDVHKYVAIFDNPPQRISFGALGYEDFTTHGDTKRKQAYLRRHRRNEDWNDPRTAGALSRWILWNKPSIRDSFEDYIDRFDMRR